MSSQAASDLKHQSACDVQYQSASDVNCQPAGDAECDSKYQGAPDTIYQSVYVMSDQKDECIIATEVRGRGFTWAGTSLGAPVESL